MKREPRSAKSSPSIAPSTRAVSPYYSRRRSSSIASGFSSVTNSFNLNSPYTNGRLSSSYSPSISFPPLDFNKLGDYSNVGPNSISELVVDEHHHNHSTFRAPTTRDIPPITLTPIKKIKRSEFDKYLNDITYDYDTFYESKSMQRDDDDSTSVDSTINDNSDRITPLSTIPSVFFDLNFQLDNPRIFDIVSEKSDIIRSQSTDSNSRKILANNSILQEKLSWYIDTVELHLINEISNASTSFFLALDDLRSINSQASNCIERIQRLRKDLHLVEEKRAQAGIESLQFRQRRRNVGILTQSLQQISMVLTKSDESEGYLLSSNQPQISRCLDSIDATEALLAGDDTNSQVYEWIKDWKFPICDLREVKGLADLRENLCVLRNKAGESYGAMFTNILIEDLRHHAEKVPKFDTLKRLGRVLKSKRKANAEESFNMAYLDTDGQFRHKLEECFEGLVRSNNISIAFKSYKELVIREAKNLVRMHLPSKSDSTSAKSQHD